MGRKKEGDDLLRADSSHNCHRPKSCPPSPLPGCFLLLFPYLALCSCPISLCLSSPHTLPISHPPFHLFYHILLSLSAFWFLIPVLWPLLSRKQAGPPHTGLLQLCQCPPTLAFSSQPSFTFCSRSCSLLVYIILKEWCMQSFTSIGGTKQAQLNHQFGFSKWNLKVNDLEWGGNSILFSQGGNLLLRF